MLTVLGILLLVAGAVLTFAVDWQAEGVDVQAVGWILMAGGGLSLLAAALRAAGFAAARSQGAASPRSVRDDGRLGHGDLVVEDRRAA